MVEEGGRHSYMGMLNKTKHKKGKYKIPPTSDSSSLTVVKIFLFSEVTYEYMFNQIDLLAKNPNNCGSEIKNTQCHISLLGW